jgi:peptide-methionine (R)-S-oxide reductase
MKQILIFLIVAAACQQCSYSQSTKTKIAKMDTINKKNNPVYSNTDTSKVNLKEEEWKKVLPEEVYNIARLKGTERPWSSPFEAYNEKGTYYLCSLWQRIV